MERRPLSLARLPSCVHTQRPWTNEEDETVRHLVAEQRGIDGANRWAEIAKFLPGRNGKQCRERWHNQLDPAIRKDAWSAEEDAMLIAKQVRGSRAIVVAPPSNSHDRPPSVAIALLVAEGSGQQMGRDRQIPSWSHRQRHQKPLELRPAASGGGRRARSTSQAEKER